jgi:predicted transposase YdaD
MPEHDNSYKLLFSHAEMVADLLRGFVREPWVNEVDLDTLERVSGSFVSDDLRDREDDIIWRIRWRGRWLYVYLLLEFQSTVDPFMALRIMVYVGLLHQDLVRRKELTDSKLLPPVLPVVLYNGPRPWTAPLDVGELVEPLPGGLDRYRPQLRYLLLDERRYEDDELAPLRNLVAALFRLENSRQMQDFRRVLSTLIEWLTLPAQESLLRAFFVWVSRVALRRRLPGVVLPELHSLQEVNAMLQEHDIDWTRDWREQGLAEGRAVGLTEGRAQGRAEIFLRLLDRKFGPLEESQRRKVRETDPDTLLEWSDRVLTAERWEDVVA